MRLGTTPTHTFTLPFEAENISKALIVYAQSDREVLRKIRSDCHMEGNTLSVKLTQKETFRFNYNKKVQIQVRVLTTAGKALTSNIITADAEKCLSNEVL